MIRYLSAASLGILLLSAPIHAATEDDRLTGGFVIKEMNAGQENGLVTGAVGMYAHLLPHKSRCALAWFQDGKGDSVEFLHRVFEKYPDKEAVPLIYAVLNRKCPDEPAEPAAE